MTADVDEMREAEGQLSDFIRKETNMPHEDDDDLMTSMTIYTMTDDQYYASLEQLNDDQNAIIAQFTAYYDAKERNENPEPIRLFITGGAGVGKSFLIKVLSEMLIRRLNKRAVLLTAYSASAAKLIGGQTVHTALRISIDQAMNHKHGPPAPLDASARDKLQSLYADVELMISDEVSLLPYTLLKAMHHRLNELFDCANASNAMFGNKHVILVGDFHQIRPVGSTFACLYDEKPQMFNDYFKIAYLTQNMRQKDDLPFTNMLNRIRIGIRDPDDIATLTARTLIAIEQEPWASAVHLYSKVENCDRHNMKKLRELTNASGDHVYTITAKDSCSSATDAELPQFMPDKKNKRTKCQLPDQLKIAKNARVMLLRNINTLEGLVNGATGIVKRISLDPNTKEPNAIHILFDDQLTKRRKNLLTEILPLTVGFTGKCNKYITRRQFPLMLTWAATFHKSQGKTLERAVIDLGTVWNAQMGYVALSRVQKLENIALIDFNPKKAIWCCPEIVTYYKDHNAPWKDEYPEQEVPEKTKKKRKAPQLPNDESDQNAKKAKKD